MIVIRSVSLHPGRLRVTVTRDTRSTMTREPAQVSDTQVISEV